MAEVDLDALRRRLAAAEIADVAPLVGGASSLTFRGARFGREVVIKVAPPGVEPVAHRDVLRQARIIKALATTRVPVPEVIWEDPGNPPLFVMSHVDGDCVEPLFDGVTTVPDLAERYRNACRAMAALHSVSPTDLGVGGEPVVDPVAEVDRWCDTLQTVDAALVPDWQGVRDALLRTAPPAMRPSVVHGDFRLGAWVGNTSLGFSGARDVAVFHCALRAMAAACRRRGCTLDVPDARSTDNRPCGSAAGHEAGQSGDADVAVEFA
jgi:aminoglycoside phosphotransferase (APT) family kinase protein